MVPPTEVTHTASDTPLQAQGGKSGPHGGKETIYA